MSGASKGQVEFDVALSFAGEDRPYVEMVARHLKERRVKFFYDEFQVARTWGTDQVEFFADLYGRRARYVVAFISEHYVSKPWPRHERRSALARALEEEGEYFLPVRLDDSEVPGLLSTIGFVDGRQYLPEAIAGFVVEKLGGPALDSLPLVFAAVPRTPGDIQRLLAVRPDGWEHLLWAAYLLEGKAALEPKWRDYEMGFIPEWSRVLSMDEMPDFLSEPFVEMRALGENVMRVFNPEIQEAAFGAPGQSGDPDRIRHLATRLIAGYEQFLDWSQRLRATRVPEVFQPVVDVTIAFLDAPIRQIRAYLAYVINEMDGLAETLANKSDDSPIELTLELILSMDDSLVEKYGQEMRKLSAKLAQRKRI